MASTRSSRRGGALPALLVLAAFAGTAVSITLVARQAPGSEQPAGGAAAPAVPEVAAKQPGGDAQPTAPAPVPAPAPAGDVAPPAVAVPAAPVKQPLAPPPVLDPLGRRADTGEMTRLAFRNVSVEEIVPEIVRATGKVVLPQTEVLARRVTLLSDKPIPRQQALDLIFLALQQAGVAIVESRDLILLRDQAEVDRQSLPVIGPDVSLMDRQDVGNVVQKVFLLKHGNAANMGEVLKPAIPDYAKLAVDADSNQLLITGPVALLQRLEQVITSLDRPASASLITETFVLRFADSEQVATNIRDLFSDGNGQSGARRTTQAQQAIQRAQGGQGGRQQNQPQGGSTGTSANLRVTANTQQNAVTVLAEGTIIEQVRTLIQESWDRPLEDTKLTPRVYKLENIDPIKLRDILEGLFGQGSQQTVGSQGNQRTTALQQSVGPLAGQFSFQAIPDTQQLVVIARTPDNLRAIDEVIAELDQPATGGLPTVIELKHATAEDLAEQLNALLARDGTIAQTRRVDSTLSKGQTGISPFSSATTGNTGDTSAEATAQRDFLQFWWQRGGAPTDNAGASNLVGKARIVPIARQNALLILATPEYRKSIASLVDRLDRPGRQVLVAAIIVEVSGDDNLALGTRFSNSAITPTLQDGTFGTTTGAATNGNATGPTGFTGQKTDLLPGLFNTSVLNVGVNLNTVIQALAQKQNVKILSEPRIFTADNQEASFFDGQDIPFITESQPNTQGNLVQSFDYRAVGIQLRVRPRITPERDVDLKVNLQLSSTVPGQTLFGGAIIDRRETTTQLIVQDAQTIVISGIIRAEDSDLRRKVPVLGDIPGLNFFFSSTEKRRTTTELIAFVTPIVVNNRSDVDAINQPYRDRLESLRGSIKPPDPATSPSGNPDPTPESPTKR